MYVLIKAQMASMYELKYIYTLDEALKLFALVTMSNDIERARIEEMNKK